MCEADAYLLRNDTEEKLMEGVDRMDIDGDQITMVDMFGEQKVLRARVRSYNNSESKILLEEIG